MARKSGFTDDGMRMDSLAIAATESLETQYFACHCESPAGHDCISVLKDLGLWLTIQKSGDTLTD
jgi:hypothetical protein